MGQLLRFPAGRFDDAVDVMSLFGRGLETITHATPERTDDEPAYVQDGAWMQ
jgi:hypothetical protein